MRTRAVSFPFDLFGSGGTGDGARLLIDALREILDDAAAETMPARSRSYRRKVKIEEVTLDSPEHLAFWKALAQSPIEETLGKGEFLIWLAGNHLGVLPIYEALGVKTLVIQFDAHLDVFHLAENIVTPTHGNFLKHAETALPRIINVGSRDLLLMPKAIEPIFSRVISAEQVAADPSGAVGIIIEECESAERVWIDIDADAFDPSQVPAVTHPMPFGLSTQWVLGVLARLDWSKVAGISISEFEPGRDEKDKSLAALSWLLEWVLLRVAEIQKD